MWTQYPYLSFQSYFDAILINLQGLNTENMYRLPFKRRHFQRYVLFMKHAPNPDRKPPLTEYITFHNKIFCLL